MMLMAGLVVCHWYPDRGIFDFIDPETGEDLITDEGDSFVRDIGGHLLALLRENTSLVFLAEM